MFPGISFIYELMGDSKDLYKVGSEDGAILRKVEKAGQVRFNCQW